jgi:hypothetical protein
MWWGLFFGVVVTVAVLGYVAHKYPAWFGKAVDGGAGVVNSIDDKVKDAVNKK